MKKRIAIVLALAAAISCGSFAGADGQNPAEDTGAGCAFEYAPVDNTTKINSVAMGDSEAAVREKMGESDDETETADMKELVYNNVTIVGHETELHILLGDDMVRAFRIVTHEGSGDTANGISEFMEAMSNGAAPELSEDKVQSIGKKYCGLSDFSQLGYFGRFAEDGCMMLYIRTSEKDIELIILDHYLQFREELVSE